MDLQELGDQVSIILNHFFLEFKRLNLMRDMSVQFAIPDFGIIVCCIDRNDYSQINDVLNRDYLTWRKVFVALQDDLSDLRYNVLWELMRSGYMCWLRSAFPRQLKNVLLGTDNLGTRIIQERLRIWGNKVRYKFLIADNEFVLRNGILQEFSKNPGFFDYMPEQ